MGVERFCEMFRGAVVTIAKTGCEDKNSRISHLNRICSEDLGLRRFPFVVRFKVRIRQLKWQMIKMK